MKTRLLSFTVTAFLSVVLSAAGQPQKSSARSTSSEISETVLGKTIIGMTPEEKVVRAAYEKLTMLNKAALLIVNPSNISPRETEFLRFELSNFRVGRIREILGSRVEDLKTEGGGEIIELGRSVTQLNKEEEHVAYRADWAIDQWVAIYDHHWTVRNLFNRQPSLYYDVSEYALYDVVVFFKGKSRAYRSLALFHNAYGSTEELRPLFWDTIVGSGGTLTEVWNEQRPAVGQKASSSLKASKSSIPLQQKASALERPFKIIPAVWSPNVLKPLRPSQDYASQSYSETDGLGDTVTTRTEDYTEHSSRSHGEEVGFQGSCSNLSASQQFCTVNFAGWFI